MERIYEEKRYKAVFRTKIDFKYNESREESLLPGHTYYLERGFNEKVSYTNISDEAVRIINSELKPELQKYTDVSIDGVQVQAVYEGSIEIIYTVILGFLNLVSGLKDLYDTVYLINEISELYINKKLTDRFVRYFQVDTYVIRPGKSGYRYLEDEMRWNCSVDRSVEKRDMFFHYLLVTNIILLIISGVLVFEAVKIVYFGG